MATSGDILGARAGGDPAWRNSLQQTPDSLQYLGERLDPQGTQRMGSGRNRPVFRHIDRLCGAGSLTGLSDSQLLDRFASRRDEEAFAALMARHGPMVLGVCRRALTDPHDAEDAFQATFLVLVDRARACAIQNQELLGNWLYGVARRVARRARIRAVRRKSVEALAAATLSVLAARDAHRADLREILDHELAQLSARDRMVIVLCDLEGRSGEEAAHVLGVRAVALRSRLLRARRRLKSRLIRRGVAPGASLAWAATGDLPSPLAKATLVSAMQYVSSPAPIGAVSAPVAALTEGFLRTTMMMTKLKAVASVAFLCLAASSVGVLAQVPRGNGPADQPGRYNSEDRLRDVEHKLDRVLSALEGLTRPTAPGDPFMTPKRANPAHEGIGLYESVPAQATPSFVSPTHPPVGMEQRLADLERRLADLERYVHRGSRGDAPQAKTPAANDQPK
jgi:RNA polymerase sigma factor (sigma-70 family)